MNTSSCEIFNKSHILNVNLEFCSYCDLLEVKWNTQAHIESDNRKWP
jgi:hypothetical protein